MTRKLIICNPGTPENRKLYAKALERLGLLPNVEWMIQVGTTIKDLFPNDFADDFNRAGAWAYADTLRALAMYPQGEPYEYAMYDYEERHEGYNWMLDKLYNGYTDNDNAFVLACLRGMQEAMPDAIRSWYNTPIASRGLTEMRDVRNLISLDAANEFGIVWHDMYMQAEHLTKDITLKDSTQIQLRNNGQYQLKAKLRKQVATMLFLHYHATVPNTIRHTKIVLDSTHRDCNHIGIWSDLRSKTNNQIERLEAVAPDLLEWLGG